MCTNYIYIYTYICIIYSVNRTAFDHDADYGVGLRRFVVAAAAGGGGGGYDARRQNPGAV